MAESNNPNNQVNPGADDEQPVSGAGTTNDGPDMIPYAVQGEAQGGWVQFPQDDSGSPRAVGGESIMSPRYPEDGGGRGYSITALRGAGSNPYGYADPNQLVDTPGTKPWYDSFGNTDRKSVV